MKNRGKEMKKIKIEKIPHSEHCDCFECLTDPQKGWKLGLIEKE